MSAQDLNQPLWSFFAGCSIKGIIKQKKVTSIHMKLLAQLYMESLIVGFLFTTSIGLTFLVFPDVSLNSCLFLMLIFSVSSWLHLLLEMSGINKLYCKYGRACIT